MIKRGCFIFVFVCLLLDATVNGFRRCIKERLLISNGEKVTNSYSIVQCPKTTDNCNRLSVNIYSNDGRIKIILYCNCTYIFIYQTALIMWQRRNTFWCGGGKLPLVYRTWVGFYTHKILTIQQSVISPFYGFWFDQQTTNRIQFCLLINRQKL